MDGKIKLFKDEKIRAIWDPDKEDWFFSTIDIVSVLADTVNPTTYWRKLKQRSKEEGNETVTDCHGFKFPASDGKML